MSGPEALPVANSATLAVLSSQKGSTWSVHRHRPTSSAIVNTQEAKTHRPALLLEVAAVEKIVLDRTGQILCTFRTPQFIAFLPVGIPGRNGR
jgi:hypothetical protein